MRKALRQLKGYVGRVRREGRSHLQDIPEGAPRGRVLEALWLVGRLLEQTRIANPAFQAKVICVLDPDGVRLELVEAPGDPFEPLGTPAGA